MGQTVSKNSSQLLPALAHYLLELPTGRGRGPSFLARNSTVNNGSYNELLTKNIEYNLGRAAPFAANPVASNLISLREGQPVGNWRDSNAGLGYGIYAYDVNTALVPASLRAIAALSNANIISPSYASNASQLADVWESKAYQLFEVNISAADATSRMANYISATNLTNALIGNATQLNATSFYALSLNSDGSPVQVMHSDLGFNLLYSSNVTNTTIQRVVDILRPYPQGLLTNVGMLVAK